MKGIVSGLKKKSHHSAAGIEPAGFCFRKNGHHAQALIDCR